MTKKMLKNKFVVALAICLLFIGVGGNSIVAQAATPSFSATRPGMVSVNITSGTLTIRDSGSTSGAILGSLKNYATVMVIGESGDFWKVVYNTSGSIGYISKTYTNVINRNYYLQVKDITGGLNMRLGSSTIYESIAKIPGKTYFAYSSAAAASPWYVGHYGDKSGYVSNEYCIVYTF